MACTASSSHRGEGLVQDDTNNLWRWYCVYCTFCKAHPAHALSKDKFAIGGFGEPAKGFAWERVKSHILSEEHKACKGYATKSTASSIKQSLEKAALQKNIITGNSKTAQVQRIINTIHLIAMRDLPDAMYTERSNLSPEDHKWCSYGLAFLFSHPSSKLYYDKNTKGEKEIKSKRG